MADCHSCRKMVVENLAGEKVHFVVDFDFGLSAGALRWLSVGTLSSIRLETRALRHLGWVLVNL